jgi:hypothetical protein
VQCACVVGDNANIAALLSQDLMPMMMMMMMMDGSS